jgi:aspartate kinase
MEKNAVTGMSIDENCIMVNITDIPFSTDNIAKIFNALAKENINIDMISQTAPHNGLINIAFTGTRDEADHMERIISELINDMPGVEYEIDTTLIKLSVVGIGMVSSPGVAASIFDILSTNKIPFYQVTTSEISISYTINEEDKDKAVRLIAYKFDL